MYPSARKGKELAKSAGFYGIQLVADARHLIGQVQARTVVEMSPVGRVEMDQLQVVLHSLPHGGIGLCKYFRHEEERRSGIETITILLNERSTPAWLAGFFKNCDFMPAAGQTSGGSDASQASSNHDNFH